MVELLSCAAQLNNSTNVPGLFGDFVAGSVEVEVLGELSGVDAEIFEAIAVRADHARDTGNQPTGQG